MPSNGRPSFFRFFLNRGCFTFFCLGGVAGSYIPDVFPHRIPALLVSLAFLLVSVLSLFLLGRIRRG